MIIERMSEENFKNAAIKYCFMIGIDPFERVFQHDTRYDVCAYCEQWQNYVDEIKKVFFMNAAIDAEQRGE